MKKPKLRLLRVFWEVLRFSWWYAVRHRELWVEARAKDKADGPLWHSDSEPVWRRDQIIDDATFRLRNDANQFSVEHWFAEEAAKS